MEADERDTMALHLRQVLIEAREAAGMTQKDLAKLLKRTQTFVSNYERGERKVGVVEFVLIARALGADAREMIGSVEALASKPH